MKSRFNLTVNQGVVGSSPTRGAKGKAIGLPFFCGFDSVFYLYILYSPAADRFYVGHSQNPWERLIQHNQNSTTKYTGKFHDWQLKAVFQVGESRGQALKIEQWIKRQKSRNLILQLTDPGFTPEGHLAQLVRVPHLRD